MDESATPFGENDMRQSAHKKTFELPTGSPSYFFMHILPHLVLSKLEILAGCGNIFVNGIIEKKSFKVKGFSSLFVKNHTVRVYGYDFPLFFQNFKTFLALFIQQCTNVLFCQRTLGKGIEHLFAAVR